MVRFFTAAWLAGAVCLPAIPLAQSRATAASAPTIPIVAGLITVSAVHEPATGDYESILKVSDVTSDGVVYTVSGNVDDRRVSIRRKVPAQDWTHAHEWRPRYNEEDDEIYPGTDRRDAVGGRAARSRRPQARQHEGVARRGSARWHARGHSGRRWRLDSGRHAETRRSRSRSRSRCWSTTSASISRRCTRAARSATSRSRSSSSTIRRCRWCCAGAWATAARG